MKKSLFEILFVIIGLLFVLPSEAKISVKRQSTSMATRTQKLHVFAIGETNDVSAYGLYLDGAKSATLSADGEGHTHLFVYDTEAGKELEVNLDTCGVEYDEVPDKIKEYMKNNPGGTYEDAFNFYSDDEELVEMWKTKPVFNSDMLFECVTIYICGAEIYDPFTGLDQTTVGNTVNSSFYMTGGKINAIVAAGDRYMDSSVFKLPSRKDTEIDKGTVNIYISGGSLSFVAPSVWTSKAFSGDVNIYMQNCHYTGTEIPNFVDSLCTATFVSTGVTYDNDSALVSCDTASVLYSQAANNVIQSFDGKMVTCFGNGTINLPELQPIDCETFVIKPGNKLATYSNINTKNFLLLSSTTKPNPYSLFVANSATVNTKRMIVGENAIVRNLGTVNIEDNDGYVCLGTWEDSFTVSMINRKTGLITKKTIDCTPATVEPEIEIGDVNRDGVVNIADVNAVISIMCGGGI